MSKRLRVCLGVCVLLAGAVAGGAAALLLSIGGGPGAEPVGANQQRWTIEDARSFRDFPLYWLGESYSGLPLKQIIRIRQYPPPGQGYPEDDVTFVYDDGRPCRTPGAPVEGGCRVPLVVVVGRACLYPPGMLGETAAGQLTTARGALVQGGDGGIRAWSGDVVIRVESSVDGVLAADVFQDLSAVAPGGLRAGENFPAGPDARSVAPVNVDALYGAGGGC